MAHRGEGFVHVEHVAGRYAKAAWEMLQQDIRGQPDHAGVLTMQATMMACVLQGIEWGLRYCARRPGQPLLEYIMRELTEEGWETERDEADLIEDLHTMEEMEEPA